MSGRMIKRLLRLTSAKKVVSNYDSYSDFAYHASKKEKTVVIEQAIKKANKLQRELAGSRH